MEESFQRAVRIVQAKPASCQRNNFLGQTKPRGPELGASATARGRRLETAWGQALVSESWLFENKL